jgi:hypothetical protein
MNLIEKIFIIIKNHAKELEKTYLQSWGLIARHEHSFERYITLQCVWVIGAIILALGALIFSFALSKASIIGLTLPGLFWFISFVSPFDWIAYKILFKNYSIKASLNGQYRKKNS